LLHAMLGSMFLSHCSVAFVPSHTPTVTSRTRLFSSSTTTYSSPADSPARVAEAQAIAETTGRKAHDNFAMNALFASVEERPDPTPCAISSASPTSSLPRDLPRGCLLKIGPNGATPQDGWMDGDGLVHAITLPPMNEQGDEDIMYSATYVDTKGRRLEREAANGKIFKGTLGAAPQGLPMLGNLFQNGLTFGTLDVQKDTCNTALAVSGSRILALMEQSPPSEIQMDKSGRMTTVESFTRLDGAIPFAPISGGCLGAHGRTDPITGERVHVSYTSNAPPYVRIDTFAENWKLQSSVGIDVPSPVMVHDCALTKNYVVILDFPLTIRPERMFLQNKFPVEYEPQNGARIGLTPRGFDNDQTLWFDVESGVVLHAIHAYEREEDGMVVLHAFKATPDGSSSFILEYTPSFLHEWVLDPTTGETVSERCLNPNVMVEFPTCRSSPTGDRRSSSAYGLVSTSIGGPLRSFKTPTDGVLLDGVVKFALENDAERDLVVGDVASRFDLPNGWHLVSEPTAVAKVGGDGEYILLLATYVPPGDDDDNKETYATIATDGTSMKTQLLILDGDCISNGPVTSVDLPYHVNYGLHSEFVSWDLMEGPAHEASEWTLPAV